LNKVKHLALDGAKKKGNRFDPENQSAVKTYLLLVIGIYPPNRTYQLLGVGVHPTMNWVSIGRAALSVGPVFP
jgi:hypothetical protein